MYAVRTFGLVAVIGAGAAIEAMYSGSLQGEVIEMLPMVARDATCAELPKLCTGPAMMYSHATIVTYLCPEITPTHERSTMHVTITKTITVAPPEVKPTDGSIAMPVVVAPSLTQTEESDTTTTIHSTLIEYKTITLFGRPSAHLDASTPPYVSITECLSATMPTELLSVLRPIPTEAEEPVFTIQTSTNPAVTSVYSFPMETEEPALTVQTSTAPAVTSVHGFPSMLPPVVDSTTTGIFYSAWVANSSLVHPTPFFPNTTSAKSHYALPTLNVANRAAETQEAAKGAAGKLSSPIAALVIGVMVVVFHF